MTSLAAALAVALSAAPAGPRPDVATADMAGLQHWYEKPRPDLVVPVLRQLASAGSLRPGEDRSGIATLFALILRRDPSLVEPATDVVVPLGSEAHSFWRVVLWRCGTAEAKRASGRLPFPQRAEDQDVLLTLWTQRPPDPLVTPVAGAGGLDVLWASFFVSGDERYVRRIVDVAAKGTSSTPQEASVLSGARWSLAAVGSDHPRVVQVLRAEERKRKGEERKRVHEVLQEAERTAREARAAKAG